MDGMDLNFSQSVGFKIFFHCQICLDPPSHFLTVTLLSLPILVRQPPVLDMEVKIVDEILLCTWQHWKQLHAWFVQSYTTCEAGRSLKRSTLGCLSFRGRSTPTALGRSSPGRNHLSGPVLSLREKLVSDLSCQITNMSSTSPVCVRCQAEIASQFLLNFGVCLFRWRFEATRHPLAPDCVEFGCLTFVYSSLTSIPERRAWSGLKSSGYTMSRNQEKLL